MYVDDHKGIGKRIAGVSYDCQTYGGRRTHTYVLRSQDRQRMALQRHSNFGTSAVTACKAAKQSIKENAPMWARVLAFVVEAALVSITLFLFSTLIGAIDMGLII